MEPVADGYGHAPRKYFLIECSSPEKIEKHHLICILEHFKWYFELFGLHQDNEIEDFLHVDDFTADGDIGSLDVITEAATSGIVILNIHVAFHPCRGGCRWR